MKVEKEWELLDEVCEISGDKICPQCGSSRWKSLDHFFCAACGDRWDEIILQDNDDGVVCPICGEEGKGVEILEMGMECTRCFRWFTFEQWKKLPLRPMKI